MTVQDFVRERPSEIYLETEFLKKKCEKITGTVEDSWRIFADKSELEKYFDVLVTGNDIKKSPSRPVIPTSRSRLYIPQFH